ncbi:GH24331 [Drosophila grimshawi]|uniref:eIF-4F 25 kDa subunit n=1 Tax=Drosophila grimshawi TaxID=7222 RepID=B4JMH0_DROGR|nr:GH24331 [Drosophila grimshawi]
MVPTMTENLAADKESAVALAEAGVTNKFGLMPYDYNSVAPLFKHPSQNIWKLWYFYYDRTKAWPDMQNEITSVATVEDFWEVYNHIKLPSEIKLGCDYSLFKSNIRPMWEDAANKYGGRWVLTLHKERTDDLDILWENVMLCLIGEVFDYMDEICGAVVSIRGQTNKISIWTSNGYNKDTVLAIGHKILQTLCLGQKNMMHYQLHKHSMAKHGSHILATYTL